MHDPSGDAALDSAAMLAGLAARFEVDWGPPVGNEIW